MPIHDPASLAAILARWRKARLQLAESAPGSPESDRLAARVHDLAEEYQAAIRDQYRSLRDQAGQGRARPAPG